MDAMKRAFFESFRKLRNQSFWEGCFHADQNCSERIIKAHSIQNNKILNKISENGEVLMFGNELDESFELKAVMKKEGRKRATTFTGFCGHHDTTIFNPIENLDYQIGNKQQEFLFAYRALAHEYHAKKSTAEIARKSLELIKKGEFVELNKIFEQRGEPSQDHIQFMRIMFEAFLEGSKDAEERLEIARVRMNGFLDYGYFDELITEVIEFPEEYHIATSATVIIEKDLEGNIVNDLNDFQTALAPTFVTVFPQSGKTYVLLSYLKRNQRRFKFIKSQILTKSVPEQKIIISNLLISYVENLAFSPIKWRQLDDSMQKKISAAFLNTATQLDKPLLLDKDIDIFVL
ncbi:MULTISPECIES: hypothetical protein [unclassified Paenibacillus]|uniref:hypothetical protein n=1 Tax=unclassified Paenibacillus TaxID=185978 RepID=UPI0024067973|nr:MULTISPECIES: hypothetical protein [unclassified Paenibacillus]MDF9841776.1 hypothetical protein [Paenibacillus sp. PastF-2]MDF9848543.1 hypothetical protein [Paenibacillus sp. PastM-2]MDF9854935.1 hypothetical protein [Paenibacillus sp. PastF-1]MDH6480205.1 hypothetical protein [Paenibacillus sp. PastH-2]MDH6507811.1 hypothetical protein [Paenibacillus sp. PastM-3]